MIDIIKNYPDQPQKFKNYLKIILVIIISCIITYIKEEMLSYILKIFQAYYQMDGILPKSIIIQSNLVMKKTKMKNNKMKIILNLISSSILNKKMIWIISRNLLLINRLIANNMQKILKLFLEILIFEWVYVNLWDWILRYSKIF